MATARTSVIANVEFLNLKNYEDWRLRVKTYLLAKDLWDVVEGTAKQPPENEDGDDAEFKAWRKKVAKALYAIQSSCGDDTFSLIRTFTTAKEAWDTLAVKSKPDDQPPKNTPAHALSLMADLAEEARVEDERSKKVRSMDTPTDGVVEPTDGDRLTEDLATEACAEGEVKSKNNDKDNFVNLWESGKWHDALLFVKQHPEVASARLSNGETALHAATLAKSADFGIELAKLMTPKDLEINDDDGAIALHKVILRGAPDNFKLVKFMVEKNKELLSIPYTDGRTSLLLAQMKHSGDKVAQYLYTLTDRTTLARREAADLICSGLLYKRYDIAWDLIKHDVSLAVEESIDGGYPFTQLASLRSEVFLSGTKLAFWEKLIYKSIFIKPLPKIVPTVDDSKVEPVADDFRIEIQDTEKEKDSLRHLLSSRGAIISKLRTRAAALFSRGLQVGSVIKDVKLFGIKRIYRQKEIHVRVLEFLECMCEILKPEGLSTEVVELVYEGIFLAIEQGHVEFVSRICKTRPTLLRTARNEKNQTIYQVAAETRQEKIFNLIYHLNEGVQRTRVSETDNSGNNMLHIIGNYSPLAENNTIRGPALQMQRELQWYKEVESIAGPGVLEMVNEKGEAPQELFTETHKDLVKKGEESMKDTATASTVIGALIVTIMFAAAFTVPGGSNQDTGLPIFLRDKVFKIFIVSDVIALSASTTSVIIFLGILTSRFSEKDFLIALPTRMILSLSTLFISISAMMVAFAAAIFIMLHGNLSIVFPTIACVSVPIISFVWMQFPFLVEIFNSTYGSGVFKKNVEHWL